MPVERKLVLAVSLLAAGVSAAFFFRKDASQFQWQEAYDDFPQSQRVERRLTSSTPAAGAGSTAVRPSAAPSQSLRVPASATASISEPKTSGDSGPTFQKSFHPVGALLEPIEATPQDEADEPAAASGDEEAAITHKIIDGDTLSSLAIQYLGRADRYREIFDANRDVLSTPDLLPIGMLLRIPPRENAATPQSEPKTADTSSPKPPAIDVVPVAPR